MFAYAKKLSKYYDNQILLAINKTKNYPKRPQKPQKHKNINFNISINSLKKDIKLDYIYFLLFEKM